MEGTAYRTKGDVLRRAQEIVGIPLKEVDASGRLATGKGAIGTVIEESWFGYSPNAEAEPDFPEAGVELKVTPYVHGKNGIRAKERLVCNIINYMEEYDRTFQTSSFWHKCNTMLLMSYEHRENVPKGDFRIDKAVLSLLCENIGKRLFADAGSICALRAGSQIQRIAFCDLVCAAIPHLLHDRLPVVFDDHQIFFREAAYSLKSTYMTQILRKYIFGIEEDERIVKDWHALVHASFEEHLIERLSPYYGKTQRELKQLFGIEKSPKNLNDILLGKMLGIHGRIAQTDEFKKAGIVPKTIRVRRDGTIKECMSFPPFDFIKLSQETEWEESEFYNYLAPTKFLFVIFQENANGELVFERVQFWNIPVSDLEEVGRVWKRTVDTIRRGVVLRETARGVSNDLPKQSESRIAHVRPHAQDGRDRAKLPDGRMMTKQCFWLNNTYIAEQIRQPK